MGEVVVGNSEIDCWREVVPVQHEDRQLTVQVLFRTLKYSTAAKEYHVKLTSEEDDCFLYRTVITPEEHRRLMLSHSMNISFDQLPEYFRQLLKAVKHEDEYGERYFINVLAQNTPGLAPRIELLITMRQAGYVVQNKRLCLPFTLASDSDFKEHLIGCFDKIKKEKEQLKRSVSLLETQLQDERVRSRELEDKNRWLQKELEFSQGLLKSAENIQKHYESLLHQKHRGEIGGSVLVKIEDSMSGADGSTTGLLTGLAANSKLSTSSLSIDRGDTIRQRRTTTDDDASVGADLDDDQLEKRSPVVSTEEESGITTMGILGISPRPAHISIPVHRSADCEPSIHGTSPASLSVNVLGLPAVTTSSIGGGGSTSNLLLAASSTSPVDKKTTTLKGAAKRKASFHNYTTNQSQSSMMAAAAAAHNAATSTSSAGTTTTMGSSSTGGEDKPTEPSHRPPPRKFAAAMVQVESQLAQIRREQEQHQKKMDDDDDEDDEQPKMEQFSSNDPVSMAETATAGTSPPPPPQPLISASIGRQLETTLAMTTTGSNSNPNMVSGMIRLEDHRSPPSTSSIIPPRPFSHPPVLIPPVAPPPSVVTSSHHQSPQMQHLHHHQQSLFAAPPPPSLPSASSIQVPAASIPAQLPPHLQTSWHHLVSNSPSLPVVSGLHLPMAAAFGHHHHEFVGLGVPPYLLPTLNTVTGGVVAPMASTAAAMAAAVAASSSSVPSTSAYVSMAGGHHYEDEYNQMPENYHHRNMSGSSEVMNERSMADEMSGDAWAMIPKSEPNDYQDDRLSDTCSRESAAVMPGGGMMRNGVNSSAGGIMIGGHRQQLMSTMAASMNENSMGGGGGGSESPAPGGGPPTGTYSASASPSLSTSSADGVDGVISYLKCLICERSFGQEGAAQHMAQHITDPQRCTICTEMPPFPSKDELVKHMIGHCARAYACRYCGKENPRVHYLKIHVRSHTGEKPYTCLQCGRGFADASTWRRHERVHTGEKPYECTICGRRIARRDNVKIHMRSHMRSKVQMSCRTCGKVFAQPNHLVLHERMCGGGGGDLKPGSSADIPLVD